MNSIRAVVLRNRKLTASQSKAPAKRSQHVNATLLHGRNMLCSFGHHVAMCCDMFGVVGSSLKMVKFEPTTPNMLQHVATGWPNARSMLRPTIAMLQYVALAWCDRLAGALPEETKFLFSHKPVVIVRSETWVFLSYFIRLKYKLLCFSICLQQIVKKVFMTREQPVVITTLSLKSWYFI